MTEQDWKKVEASMNSPFGRIVLNCDGYLFTLVTGLYKKRLTTTFFVNGVWEGKWMMNDCEERRRFFRPQKIRIWKPSMFKGMSKRMIKSLNINPDETRMAYETTWSFRALKSHLVKHNTSIALVEE